MPQCTHQYCGAIARASSGFVALVNSYTAIYKCHFCGRLFRAGAPS